MDDSSPASRTHQGYSKDVIHHSIRHFVILSLLCATQINGCNGWCIWLLLLPSQGLNQPISYENFRTSYERNQCMLVPQSYNMYISFTRSGANFHSICTPNEIKVIKKLPKVCLYSVLKNLEPKILICSLISLSGRLWLLNKETRTKCPILPGTLKFPCIQRLLPQYPTSLQAEVKSLWRGLFTHQASGDQIYREGRAGGGLGCRVETKPLQLC